MKTTYLQVSDDVVSKLWPEKETRPAMAWRCSRCKLITTNKANHESSCPEKKKYN